MAKYKYEASLEGKRERGGAQFSLFFVGDDSKFSRGGDGKTLYAMAYEAVAIQNPGFLAERQLISAKVVGYTQREKIEENAPLSDRNEARESSSKSSGDNSSSPWWLRFIKWIFRGIWGLIKSFFKGIFGN